MVIEEGLIYTIRNSIKHATFVRGRGIIEEEEIVDQV